KKEGETETGANSKAAKRIDGQAAAEVVLQLKRDPEGKSREAPIHEETKYPETEDPSEHEENEGRVVQDFARAPAADLPDHQKSGGQTDDNGSAIRGKKFAN